MKRRSYYERIVVCADRREVQLVIILGVAGVAGTLLVYLL